MKPLLALAALAALLLGCAVPAAAHDAEHSTATGAWIGNAGLADPVSQLSCCGSLDCRPLPDDAIEERGGGYLIKPTGEWIPHARVIRTATEDGGPWRCHFTSDIAFGSGPAKGLHRKGTTRCLILPPPGN